MPMTCPKCMAEMRHYERSGVTVDQCSECRGIFLDRGELERLVDAETSFHSPPPPQPVRPHYDDRHDDRHEYRPDYRYKKKKRGSFFEELFD
jgi:Zn-finger nucleic acid-binding protein